VADGTREEEAGAFLLAEKRGVEDPPDMAETKEYLIPCPVIDLTIDKELPQKATVGAVLAEQRRRNRQRTTTRP